MKLFVVRHGDAVDRSVDPRRPLSRWGRDEVAEVAAFLEGADVRVERVFHSGKARASDTAEILASSVMPDGRPELLEGLGPNDPIDAYLEGLESRTGDELMVGHLPFVGLLVSRLSGASVAFDAGSVVCLESTEGPEWKIVWMVGPRQIPR